MGREDLCLGDVCCCYARVVFVETPIVGERINITGDHSKYQVGPTADTKTYIFTYLYYYGGP